MRRIRYMIQKEFRQIFRDPPMLAIIFLVPVIQLFVLAYAITMDVKHIKLTVVDYDKTPASREIIRAFGNTERFDMQGYTNELSDISARMQSWDTQLALVIPRNFQHDLRRQLHPQIQVVVDGVDGNTAGVALGYARQILTSFGVGIITRPQTSAVSREIHLLTMLERMWFNLELDSQQYMVPGIVVVLLTILPMMLSGMSLVKEKEIGTLEQLMVTPLSKFQLLLGKIIPFLILSFIEMALVMSFAVLVFRIEMNGSYLLLAILSFLYLFTTIGLGIFISTFTGTQQQAMFVAWFFMVFMILMSGFFIPIENMPVLLRHLTYLNPMRYFMFIIRDIFQKGSGIIYLYRDAVPMGLLGLAIFSMGVVKFQKRLQ